MTIDATLSKIALDPELQKVNFYTDQIMKPNFTQQKCSQILHWDWMRLRQMAISGGKSENSIKKMLVDFIQNYMILQSKQVVCFSDCLGWRQAI